MSTVTFRQRPGTRKSASIKVRFKHGDQFDFELSAGIDVNRKHWSNKQQRIKNLIDAPYKEEYNKNLNELRTFIMNAYYDARASRTKITQLWLKERVREFWKEPLTKNEDSNFYFIPFIEEFINEAKKPFNRNSRVPISDSTISTYSTTLRRLIDFEAANGLELKISDINLDFHTKFVQYLSEELLLNANTIGGYISRIKLFCNSAEMQGLEINKEFKSRNFYCPQNTTNDIYLNNEEIELIFNHKFESERLDNARDFFIVCLRTGLRISDLLNLTKDNIKGDDIHVTTFKTKTPVIIPIHPQVKKTIEKYDNNFPRRISDQKFNNYIKEVCREVGLTQLTPGAKKVAVMVNGKKIYRKQFGEFPKYELISSHIGRRSYATNAYGTVNTLTIMKITGHKSEQVFLNYIKTTDKEFADDMRRSWEG